MVSVCVCLTDTHSHTHYRCCLYIHTCMRMHCDSRYMYCIRILYILNKELYLNPTLIIIPLVCMYVSIVEDYIPLCMVLDHWHFCFIEVSGSGVSRYVCVRDTWEVRMVWFINRHGTAALGDNILSLCLWMLDTSQRHSHVPTGPASAAHIPAYRYDLQTTVVNVQRPALVWEVVGGVLEWDSV